MGLNVLVADDSAVMRAMIIKTLRLSGLPVSEVHEARNGAEALEVLERHWIDLALVDVNMPVIGGEELLDRVRANPPTADLSVVIVSTESSETRRARLQEKGAAFVHKPFTPEALRDTILDITGVSDEPWTGNRTLQRSGPDF